MGRLLKVGLLGAAYGLLTVWWLWPLPAHLRTRTAYMQADIPLVGADYHLITWVLAWDAHALVTAPWRLFQANTFYPSTEALAYSEHLLGYLPLFAPPYWVTGNAILAVNLILLLTYPLCALATYCLARRFTAPAAAALAGFFYAFYLGRLHVPPHVHLLGTFWLPVALLATERWLDAARGRDAVLLAAALVLHATSSFYLAFALAASFVPYLLVALWRWRARLDRRRMLGVAAALAVVGVTMVALGLPYLHLQRLGLIPAYDAGDAANPLALMSGVGGLRVWDFLLHRSVGPIGYALVLAAFLPPWRRPDGARLGIVALLIVGTVAAFGTGIPIGQHTIWTPYAFLARWIPGASTVRMPSRFVFITQLGLALLAGLGFARLLGRARSATAGAAAIAVAVLALVSFRPFPRPPMVEEPTAASVTPAYRWLAEHGEGRAVLDEPAPGIAEAARRMYLSTFHWLPIVDGYSGYPPAHTAYLHQLAAPLPDEAALAALVDVVDVGWILVHRAQMLPGRAARWDGPLPDGLERVGQWDGDLLVRVTRAPRDDRRARLLGTHETLGGVALAPLAQCPGAIVVRRLPPSPWPSPGTAHVELDVRNDGAAAWPAFGFVPRHLVRLEACLRRDGAAPCAAKLTPLPADVPAGGAVPVGLDFPVPLIPGPHRLDVRLVQIGDGPLERCGTAPVTMPIEVLPPRLDPPPPT